MEFIQDFNNKKEQALNHLSQNLAKIRTGRASASMLDGVMINAYDMDQPINQVAAVNTPDARTLKIVPYDKNLMENLEKGLEKANLGIMPVNNGEAIILNIPMLTEETRLEITKDVKKYGEEAKVVIRNIRREINEQIKKSEMTEDDKKYYSDELQKNVDSTIIEIDQKIKTKEQEVMTI